MRLGTLRAAGGTRAASIVDSRVVLVPGYEDVGQLLRQPEWRTIAAEADGEERDLGKIGDDEWERPILAPGKIVCVGLNYRNHILEMGRQLPEHPTLFAKYSEALIGPYDSLVLPAGAADAVDWEAELAVVIGSEARRVGVEDAQASIAGYTVINDVTMRDFQYRTPEWFQGKTFERTSPLGPFVVTSDEYTLGTELSCTVDDERVQVTTTDDLVFGPAELVSYISHIFPLKPGDIIATGTPGGVGHARKPPRYLSPGQNLRTRIEGIGELRNAVVAEGSL